MVDRLKDKTAIVFGAGSSGPGWGNGKAAAVAYAREGARVACVDLVQETAEETAAVRSMPEQMVAQAAQGGRTVPPPIHSFAPAPGSEPPVPTDGESLGL